MTADSSLPFVIPGLMLCGTLRSDLFDAVRPVMRRGVHAVVVAARGLTAGSLAHIFAVAVDAVMAASATAFAVLKSVGAAYGVCWACWGIRWLLLKVVVAIKIVADIAVPTGATARNNYKNVFWWRYWIPARHPQLALLVLACVPQFIRPTTESKPLTLLRRSLSFNFNSQWVNRGWAVSRLPCP